MTTEQMDEMDDMRRRERTDLPVKIAPVVADMFGRSLPVTSISFTDRNLDTVAVNERDSVSVSELGVLFTRIDFKGSARTTFYPWNSIFSLGYAS